jgi:hypothetical protein
MKTMPSKSWAADASHHFASIIDNYAHAFEHRVNVFFGVALPVLVAMACHSFGLDPFSLKKQVCFRLSQLV